MNERPRQPYLWDLPSLPPARRGQETQQAAALAVAPFTQSMEARVLALLQEHTPRKEGGLTNEEISLALGMKIQTVCGRVADLRDMGQIEYAGFKRRTKAGVAAKVWRIRQ